VYVLVLVLVLVLVGADQWQHVGIVTRLRVGWVGVRIRAGAIFSPPDQTGPGAHPASCKWVPGLFSGGKAAGGGIDHLPHLEPRLKKELSYISTPSLRPHGLFEGEFHIYLP
jgi:hypothetical protein